MFHYLRAAVAVLAADGMTDNRNMFGSVRSSCCCNPDKTNHVPACWRKSQPVVHRFDSYQTDSVPLGFPHQAPALSTRSRRTDRTGTSLTQRSAISTGHPTTRRARSRVTQHLVNYGRALPLQPRKKKERRRERGGERGSERRNRPTEGVECSQTVRGRRGPHSQPATTNP